MTPTIGAHVEEILCLAHPHCGIVLEIADGSALVERDDGAHIHVWTSCELLHVIAA